MRYVVKLLNSQQRETLCVYANSVRDVKGYVERHDISNITNLVLILHVGKKRTYINSKCASL